jgi:HAD superfamily hydrolase (TIGR01509 family)
MPIKLIIFDLDGVLMDSRDLHYETLNTALAQYDPKLIIGRDEHLAKYDGHPTNYKLKLLTKEKGLDPSAYNQIWKAKQDATQSAILSHYTPDARLQAIMKTLKSRGYMLYCASNSIWVTVKNALAALGIIEYFDYFISNEEVRNPKPSADIYFKCFQRANVTPQEVLVCEDSPVGRRAALASGAHLCPIESPDDVTLTKIETCISKVNRTMNFQTQDLNSGTRRVNIVIPAAGLGSRFANAGYTFPKPLIDVNGKPMIQVVVENLAVSGRFIFIVQETHYEKYNLKYLLNAIAPGCVIVKTNGLTEGSACSVMLAKEHINNDDPLIIANSDQYLEWDPRQFLYTSMSEGVDGCISTFTNSHPKFSYARMDDDGYVVEVAEKKVISNNATTGIYFWKKGSDCVKYTEQMITKNIRVNGEFYNCPVFNEAIEDGKKIKSAPAKTFWCLGTPEDLDNYLRNSSI